MLCLLRPGASDPSVGVQLHDLPVGDEGHRTPQQDLLILTQVFYIMENRF